MSDIFGEVDESLRQDKLEGWWARYQYFVYGAFALVLVAVAVNEFVLIPRANAARAARALEMEKGLSELHNGSYVAAQSAFSDLAEGGSKLAPLAANYLAQTLYEGGGDAKGAADALAAIGSVEGGPYERLALLKKAYFLADDQSMVELEATLGSLVDDEGPLGALARELVRPHRKASNAAPNLHWRPFPRPSRRLQRSPTLPLKQPIQQPKRRLQRPPLQSLRRLANELIA